MSEENAPPADVESKPGLEESPATQDDAPHEFWLRVHGFPPIPPASFPFDLSKEIVSASDFYDPLVGALPGGPQEYLHVGDVLIYYADGPGVVYALATVEGAVEGPLSQSPRGPVWRVPIKRDAMIRAVNKAPHGVGLHLPSGWPFLSVVRDYTHIRLSAADGEYLVDQVRARAGAKD